MKYKKICEFCGSEFTAKKSSTRFCCHRCASIEMLMNQVNEVLIMKGINMPFPKEVPVITEGNEPIDIEEVCKLTMKARSTIYRNCSEGSLPHYKQGKRLYFFKNEMLEWIRKGKKTTYEDFL